MNFETKNKGPKACTTCARAKARCIPGPADAGKCERCHRLSKPCALQTPAPPRAKKEPRPTKVAELEKRLNELTSQLHAVQSQSEGGASGRRQSSAASSPRAQEPGSRTKVIKGFSFGHLFPESVEGVPDGGGSPHSEGPSPESHESVAGSAPVPETPPTAEEVPWPSGAEAEALLRRFRVEMEPRYPFVITPPDMDAAQLALRHPFLFKGVVVTACHLDAFRQQRLGDRLLAEVTQAAFTEPQKSLEVLQALQLLIAWFQYNLNSYQLTNMLYLARSMCLTLGFQESPFGTTGERSMGDLNQLRAFVGCYYENTMILITSKRPDAFMNPAFYETCCNILEEKAQYESDKHVVALFKIMQLSQSIASTLGSDGGSVYAPMHMSVPMVVQSFQQQLDMFRATLSEPLKNDPCLMSHVHAAQVLIYEPGIPDGRSANMQMSPADRLGLLWSCLEAIQAYFEHRFAGPIFVPPRFTIFNPSWLYVTITGIKLHTIDIPGWDINMVRARYPIERHVDAMIAEIDRFVEVRRQGRTGDQLVRYNMVKANQRMGMVVFDVYEQVRRIIFTLRTQGLAELEALSAHVRERQLRQEREMGVLQQQQQQQQNGGDLGQMSLDGSFWQGMLDDSAWMLGIDPSSMEWTPGF